MTVVKTVSPSGYIDEEETIPADYTNLADWVTWAKAQASVDVAAECYSGNLGTANFGAASTWTGTDWSATKYPRIYAADGHRHDGHTKGSGAYINFGSAGGSLFTSDCPFVIDGLHFFADDGSSSGLEHSSQFGTPPVGPRDFLNCFVHSASTGSSGGINVQTQRTATSSFRLINNVFAGSGGWDARATWRHRLGTGSQLAPCIIQNNTLRAITTGVSNDVSGDSFVWENNIVLKALSIFNTTVATITSNNNLYATGMTITITNPGGSNILSGIDQLSLFKALHSGDLRLRASSPARNAGITLVGVTTDAVGNARPEGVAYDIGGLEYQPTDEPTPPAITINGNPGASELVFRGPTAAEANFTISAEAVETLISPQLDDTIEVDDASFDVHTPATIDHEATVEVAETVPGTLDTFTFASTNELVATVNSAGRVTRVSDGTCRILCRSRLVTKGVDVTMLREAGATTNQFAGFVAGSLAKECADAIDNRISGATPSTAKPIYSVQNHSSGIYTRNASCWAADLDLTSISPWNSTGANTRAGTLITPRHVLFAWHYQIADEATIRFVDNDDNVITRTITDVQSVAGAGLSKDITIGKLDSDVSAGISFAKVLPANYADYIPGVEYGVPALALDQEEKATVSEIHRLLAVPVACHSPTTADRTALNEPPTSGDSGNPVFWIVDDELVLLTVWTYGGWGSGTNLADNLTAIDDVLTSLGGGYSATTIDLSSFTDFS